MKRTTSLIVLAIIVVSSLVAQVRSDYEVTQSFKKKYNEIQKSIEASLTVQECVEVSARIDDLEKEFANDVKLLDKALYPDGYKGKIATARLQLKLSQEKLGIIQTQFARILEMETQAKMLTEQVDMLADENTALLNQVQRLGEAFRGTAAEMRADRRMIDSLSGLIGKLRKNLKERDALIFALVDSLFMQYDKNVASTKDVEKQSLTGKLERKNVFTNVRKSIEDNLALLQSTSLTSKDIAEMVKEQRKFQGQWKATGSRLSGLYEPGKKGANQVAQIDALLVDWGKEADSAIWRGLNLAFRDKGFGIEIFGTGDELVANFKKLAEEEIKPVAQGRGDEANKRYQAFYDSLWTMELEPSWLPLLVESGKISDDQKKEFEAQVADWGNAVRPPRLWMFLVIAIVVLVSAYALYRKTKSPNVPKMQKTGPL